ncbi:MAG: tetratricopeptide repeat protein [Pontiellaceae bacterium]|nr:tetratricopeptide repeat protein [Pontiellaceae bacterium]
MKKKINRDLRNIYRTDEAETPAQAALNSDFEEIKRELRRELIFNASVGLLTFSVVVILAVLFVKNFVIQPGAGVSVPHKNAYLSAYELPEKEQWALDYRQIVAQAEAAAGSGPRDFSSKWVKNTAYHVIMGQQAIRANNLPAAQYHLEQANLTFPEMTGVQRDLGTVYLKQQKFKQAKEFLQQAQNQAPSAETLNNLGIAQMGLEEYDLAETSFRQVLQSRPDAAGCYKNLAYLYQKTGRTNEAAAAYESYFSLYPQDPPLLESYTAYLAGIKRDKEAVRFLEQLKGGDPLTVQLLLAKAAARDNDAERAVRALREASRFLTPRQMLTELHKDDFKKISQNESLNELVYQLELAAVVLSTNRIEAAPALSP